TPTLASLSLHDVLPISLHVSVHAVVVLVDADHGDRCRGRAVNRGVLVQDPQFTVFHGNHLGSSMARSLPARMRTVVEFIDHPIEIPRPRNQASGSTAAPLIQTSKCRCGPVEWPLEPTVAICWPACTR